MRVTNLQVIDALLYAWRMFPMRLLLSLPCTESLFDWGDDFLFDFWIDVSLNRCLSKRQNRQRLPQPSSSTQPVVLENPTGARLHSSNWWRSAKQWPTTPSLGWSTVCERRYRTRKMLTHSLCSLLLLRIWCRWATATRLLFDTLYWWLPNVNLLLTCCGTVRSCYGSHGISVKPTGSLRRCFLTSVLFRLQTLEGGGIGLGGGEETQLIAKICDLCQCWDFLWGGSFVVGDFPYLDCIKKLTYFKFMESWIIYSGNVYWKGSKGQCMNGTFFTQ